MSERKVFVDITMSLDGFIAGPNDGPNNGLGDGGERLHEWIYDLATWREPHGLPGGETGIDAEVIDETFRRAGSVIVGKRMFDNADGWGDNPPFHKAVFVLSHESRETLAKEGDTTFTFVTDGIESALDQARQAAGDNDVLVAGGASAVQQFLNAGMLDEIQIHIAPLFLGGGVRLFDGVGPHRPALEITRVIESPRVTHLGYRVS